MSDSNLKEFISIHVNGQLTQVPSNTNLIEALASVGTEVPHYCYHPKLSVVGNCRMCLVEVGMPMKDRSTGEIVMDSLGNPKINWMPKPAIACATQVAQGMRVRTKSQAVKDSQNGVMEFLLANHPLDCPICDQAGECSLQEYATQYGKGYSRFAEKKVIKPKRTRLGPRVMLDDERCILCSRCVRFCSEIVKEDVLGFVNRGSYSTLTCFPGKELKNNYSLNTVDICPVGALTDVDFRFKMRVWFLKPTKSICIESSVGVNTEVWSREGKIYRITPRRNDAVNDTWMSDSGRKLYSMVDSADRIKQYSIRGREVDCDEALGRTIDILKAGKIAYVGSAHQSVEEQFILKCLIDQTPGPFFMPKHEGESDEFLISKERAPNMRGGLFTGLMSTVPNLSLDGLKEKIESGEVKTVFVCNEDIVNFGVSEDLLKKVTILYMGTHVNVTSKKAHILFPSLTVFEKSGTFINQAFRLQRFFKAVPGPENVCADVILLSQLLALVKECAYKPSSLNVVWKKMAEVIPEFANHSFDSIPDSGIELEKDRFKHINFGTEKTLHYNSEES
jgi:NADH-quinone oxidoreductase subunit G